VSINYSTIFNQLHDDWIDHDYEIKTKTAAPKMIS